MTKCGQASGWSHSPIDIDAPGSYTSTLTAPLDGDRTAIEARLNARGVSLQKPGALSIRLAEPRIGAAAGIA